MKMKIQNYSSCMCLINPSTQVTAEDDSNTTTSILNINFTKEDHGKKLICRAENILLINVTKVANAVEDEIRIDIQCKFNSIQSLTYLQYQTFNLFIKNKQMPRVYLHLNEIKFKAFRLPTPGPKQNPNWEESNSGQLK